MNDVKKLTHSLDTIFLRKIISQLKDKSMTDDQARIAAKAFRALGPFTSVEDCQTKMQTFISAHPEYSELADYANAYYKEKQTHKLVTQMKKHIKNNDIDSALKIAQT